MAAPGYSQCANMKIYVVCSPPPLQDAHLDLQRHNSCRPRWFGPLYEKAGRVVVALENEDEMEVLGCWLEVERLGM